MMDVSTSKPIQHINNARSASRIAARSKLVSLIFLWLVSVLTLSRFCFLELKALKSEMILLQHSVTEERESSAAASNSSPHDPSSQDTLLGILIHALQDDDDNKDDDYYKTSDDDDSMINEETSDVLPRLILHIGPSKSATTTLQTDLTAALDDGWLTSEYLGRFYRPHRAAVTNVLMLNRSESPLLVTARHMLHSNDCSRPSAICCSRFHDALETYRVMNSTVILSDEAFGNMWTDPAHFHAIQTALSSHWKVTVVVGYRHFYEWILSSKYQRDRTDRIGNMGKVQWPEFGGRSLLPMFPDTLNEWRQWFHYTDSIVHMAKASMEVRILDLHAMTNRSILTQFLCTAQLHEDCWTSQQRDLELAFMTMMNSQANTTIPSLYYDAIATMAAEHQLVNTSLLQRSSVREAVRAFHEDTNGLAPNDLILQCPGEVELQTLLDYSLDMEKRFFILPDQQAHMDGFWSKVRDKAFCWVNALAVVQSPRWKEFFAQL